LPNILLNTAKHLPIMISSLIFSIIHEASPATSDSKTGALYKFQNRNNSPLLAVDKGTEPNRLICGSQNIFSKHKTVYFKKKV
jgi:hypothetical protein